MLVLMVVPCLSTHQKKKSAEKKTWPSWSRSQKKAGRTSGRLGPSGQVAWKPTGWQGGLKDETATTASTQQNHPKHLRWTKVANPLLDLDRCNFLAPKTGLLFFSRKVAGRKAGFKRERRRNQTPAFSLDNKTVRRNDPKTPYTTGMLKCIFFWRLIQSQLNNIFFPRGQHVALCHLHWAAGVGCCKRGRMPRQQRLRIFSLAATGKGDHRSGFLRSSLFWSHQTLRVNLKGTSLQLTFWQIILNLLSGDLEKSSQKTQNGWFADFVCSKSFKKSPQFANLRWYQIYKHLIARNSFPFTKCWSFSPTNCWRFDASRRGAPLCGLVDGAAGPVAGLAILGGNRQQHSLLPRYLCLGNIWENTTKKTLKNMNVWIYCIVLKSILSIFRLFCWDFFERLRMVSFPVGIGLKAPW